VQKFFRKICLLRTLSEFFKLKAPPHTVFENWEPKANGAEKVRCAIKMDKTSCVGTGPNSCALPNVTNHSLWLFFFLYKNNNTLSLNSSLRH
jgi:hypothetical protein